MTDEPSVRRPGPHGAASEEQIARAHRRAERTSRRSFQEITPRTVTAAEACTSLDSDSADDGNQRSRLAKTRACFIATAAYGDADAPEVEQFRRFRDEFLMRSRLGTAFVHAYYRMSPPVARLIARKPRLRMAFRKVLDLFRTAAALQA